LPAQHQGAGSAQRILPPIGLRPPRTNVATDTSGAIYALDYVLLLNLLAGLAGADTVQPTRSRGALSLRFAALSQTPAGVVAINDEPNVRMFGTSNPNEPFVSLE